MLPFILAGVGYAVGTFLEKNNKKVLTTGMEIDKSNNNTKTEPPENSPVTTPTPETGKEKTE